MAGRLCGDDADAKMVTVKLLESFGWKGPIDLGPPSAARGTEGMTPMWLRLWGVFGTADFNYHIARAER
jgi:predicted dinucleotide-binding enzyme